MMNQTETGPVQTQNTENDTLNLTSRLGPLLNITRKLIQELSIARIGSLLGVLGVLTQPQKVNALEEFAVTPSVSPYLHKLQMTWQNSSNTVFQVQVQDSVDGSWRNVVNITGSATNLTYVDEYPTNAFQFYRVVALDNAPAALTNLQMTLDRQLKNMTGVRGVVAAVQWPGGTWVGTSGYSDPTNGVPTNPNQRIEVASHTKMMHATFFLVLQERGLLNIEDPIGKYIPNLSEISTNVSPDITIRSLLNHTSGVPDYWDTANGFPKIFTNDMAKVWTPAEMVHLARKPIKGWQYSNTGYSVLELVVNEVTGKSLSQGLREEFFAPRNLPSPYFKADASPTGEVGHTFTDYYNHKMTDTYGKEQTAVFTGINGAAGASADVMDMVKFVGDLYGGKILNEASMKLMTNWVSAPGYGDGRYGLGTESFSTSTGQGLGHWADGWATQGMIVYRLQDKVTVALYSNTKFGYDNYAAFDRMVTCWNAIDRASKNIATIPADAAAPAKP